MKAVVQWVLRTMMKDQTGVMRTLPKKNLVDLNVAITAERLMRNGIDPNALKNANQVENAINQIEAPRNVQQGIKSAKSAKIIDLEGKEIDPRSKIMGGKQAETEAEILARINKENIKGIENIREKNKNYKLNLFKNLDDKKKLNDDEYEEFLEEIGGEDRLEAYEFDGTAGSAKKILKDDVEYEESMFKQYKAEKLNPERPKSNKPITSIDKQINEEFKKGMKEGKFNNVRLKDGRSIKSEDDFREYIDELNEDNNFDFAQGGRAGFFMGGPNPKGLGLLRAILNYMSKTGKETGRFKGVDLSGLDMLRLSNPKAFNKLLEDVRGKVNIKEGIMGTDTVRAQQQALREKRKGLTEKTLDVAKEMKADDDKIKILLAKEAETTIIPKVKKQLMEGMGMSEEAAEKAARDMAEAAQNIKLMDSPPEIKEEGILQLENVLKNMETGGKNKRDLNADGGRIGYKIGSIDKARRAFLKAAAGIGGGIAALKTGLLSIGKGADAVKNLPPIKTPVTKLEGTTTQMPDWFPSFINKFRDEGKAKDVFKTKKVEVSKEEFDQAFKEGKGENYYTDVARTPEYKANNPDHMDYYKRVDTDERIYTTYTNDKVPGVRVDDMDGNVDVMFENDYSQPVSMNYTAPGKRGPETGRADVFVQGEAKIETKPKGEFVANDVEVYATDPDGGSESVDVIADTVDDMLEGKTRQMEEYVTGKKTKLSRGEGRVIEAEIRAEQASDAAAEAAAEAADEFASGGIARMLGE